MRKKVNKQEIIFYQLQALNSNDKDHRLHLRADTAQGAKLLKRWTHKVLYRKLYYYDRIAEYYTIKKNGEHYLDNLERNPEFQMVQGIPRDW